MDMLAMLRATLHSTGSEGGGGGGEAPHAACGTRPAVTETAPAFRLLQDGPYAQLPK